MNEPFMEPELLAAFFDESAETLNQVAGLFVELEQRPADREVIEAIFRPIHSLKGNSAFFNFMAIKRLAHEMETVLDYVRKGKLVADQAVISTLLAGLDVLRACIDRLRAGDPEVADEKAFDAMVERQRAAGSTVGGGITQSLTVVESWLTRGAAGLDQSVRPALEQLLLRLRKDLGLSSTNAVIPPSAPTPEVGIAELRQLIAQAFTEPPSSNALTRMTELIASLGRTATDERGRTLAIELNDSWAACIATAGFNDILRDHLASQLEILITLPGFVVTPLHTATVEYHAAEAPPMNAPHDASANHDTTSKEPRSDALHRNEAGKSVRVAESRIDTFLHYVGELLVVGDMYGHLQTRSRRIEGGQQLAREFRRANDTFAQLSSKLQQAIMAIRKVPIRPQLSKVPRIVRDVAVAKGKEIEVVISGEEIEVDKSLVELLDAPLTHLARNAADHGIETPERRELAGKPRRGTVTISVQETAASIVLAISDDGGGLDLARIRSKAEALGLVAPGVEMGKADIVNFIFASGLSTAEQVSDVSGRGVGMDVVKRMIDQAGGRIDVETEAGRGSRFQLLLPKGVTTQIMVGFLVRSGGQVLVLPLDRVRETFRLRPDEVTSLPGESSGRFIVRHGMPVPLICLANALGLAKDTQVGAVVAVDAQHRRLALEVEAVLGVRKVVLRSLKGLPGSEELFSGGALLGDGTVALILNPDALIEARQDVAHAH